MPRRAARPPPNDAHQTRGGPGACTSSSWGRGAYKGSEGTSRKGKPGAIRGRKATEPHTAWLAALPKEGHRQEVGLLIFSETRSPRGERGLVMMTLLSVTLVLTLLAALMLFLVGKQTAVSALRLTA